MENVIYDIYTRVNSKLQPNSNKTLDAMTVASDIMNEPLSNTEITKIKEFSKKLEPQYSLNSNQYMRKKPLLLFGELLAG